jgi:hypothetical protein
MMPDELERLYKQILEFEGIELITRFNARADRRGVAGARA